ncbi:MAG: lysoplasmalogenase [Candidatus Hydrogenedentes bacterium]|nr:lysoplasmalogenase [Candidatus Hydrogenedentota bacterium]
MPAIYAAILTMILCVVDLASSNIPIDVPSGTYKMAASTCFIATAWLAGARQTVYGKVLLTGLIFSWFGDYFLIGGSQERFLAGLVSFFLAHVAYCVAYYVRGTDTHYAVSAGAILILPALFVAPWIWPGVPAEMRVPVVAYLIVISAMVALAVGTWGQPGSVLIVAGAILFYGSDLFVARGRFVERDLLNPLIGLPLYFGGQVLLALSIARVTADEGTTSTRDTPPDRR